MDVMLCFENLSVCALVGFGGVLLPALDIYHGKLSAIVAVITMLKHREEYI